LCLALENTVFNCFWLCIWVTTSPSLTFQLSWHSQTHPCRHLQSSSSSSACKHCVDSIVSLIGYIGGVFPALTYTMRWQITAEVVYFEWHPTASRSEIPIECQTSSLMNCIPKAPVEWPPKGGKITPYFRGIEILRPWSRTSRDVNQEWTVV